MSDIIESNPEILGVRKTWIVDTKIIHSIVNSGGFQLIRCVRCSKVNRKDHIYLYLFDHLIV
ncbi:hypothetical protein LCGC14_1139750 [marine sediment metagenome]|uniref:Uncharacterized protein n=1 Tax=marine sediment metagenome TaxID=412755 RepID=A0A0F9MLM8_9ZZZZ|nr:MAG: hypothetical protein Lokiarch_22190 [Candidatus Lokiarchaeum sp. GC14_75]